MIHRQSVKRVREMMRYDEVMRLIAELKYFGRYITMTNEYELSFMHMNRKQYDKLCELIDTAQKLTRGEKR